MSLLHLKISFKKFLLFLFILASYSTAFASENDSILAFKKLCEKSDAYLIYSYADISYSQSWGSYKRHIAIQNKMVINNKSGVDRYAFINLSGVNTNHIESIKILTHKADETVVKLDSSLVLNHFKDNDQTVDYPIPGVEPGDTIEISFMYWERLSNYELMDFVSLYNQQPCLSSEYSVRTPPNLSLKYKTYNGFPAPQTLTNDTIIYCLFKMEMVPGINENDYTCLPCELPYIYYSIVDIDDENRTWKDVYNQEFNITTQPTRLDPENSSYYNRWKRRVLEGAEDSSKYFKFELLHTDILDNTEMGYIEESEIIKSSGYFLKKKRFDPISIRRIYRQLLEDLEINYWAVFARSKQGGEIDPYYIRKGEFDHTFFLYENYDGSFNLLYPHEISYKYQINEIPTSIYNTEAVIVKPHLKEKIKRNEKYIRYDLEMAEVDSVIVELIRLPGVDANKNYAKQVVFCDIDPQQKTTIFNSRLTLSGGVSTELRSFIGLLNQDQEMNDYYSAMTEYEGDDYALDIDTITSIKLKDKKPFIYSMSAKGTIKNSISYLNDSLISITLDNLIRHSQIESESDSIDLNYYLDFSYDDFCMYIFNFPQEIEILGYDNYSKNLSNDIGTYMFNLKLVGQNSITLQSNYKILKDMIPKNNYNQLKELNQLVKETKNMRLLIKLKNTPVI